MKKINKVLFAIWVFHLPIFIALNMFFILLLEFDYIDIEFPFDGIIWGNIMGFAVMTYLVGWFINSTVDLIKLFKKEKENE